MVLVTKTDGRKEEFDEQKVRNALLRSGASKEAVEQVIEKVRANIYSEIPTNKIFKIAFTALRKLEPHAASRYDLRNAIMRLGPAGYPFETFIARILEEHGYETKLRQTLKGQCIPHEIDIVASKGREKLMVECKFHNQPWIKCHVQTALYVYARFLDLNDCGSCFTAPMLATNTKFTDEVITYAGCKGMKLIGWRSEKGESLEKMIESKKLYPITVLLTADANVLQRLMVNEIIVLKDLLKLTPKELSAEVGLPVERAQKLIDEANSICGFR